MTIVQKPHEYSSIQRVDINKKSAVLPSDIVVRDILWNKINLLQTFSGKSKVTFFSFFAEWCPNCHYEASQIKKMFDDYKTFRIDMVLVMDYSTRKNSLDFVDKYQLKMPLFFGELPEKNEEKRNNTQFYKFRKSFGDERAWGMPFHIIIDEKNPGKFGIVTGEIIEKEILQYFSKMHL